MSAKSFVCGKYVVSKAKDYTVLTVPEVVITYLMDGKEELFREFREKESTFGFSDKELDDIVCEDFQNFWWAFRKICRELEYHGMTNYEIFGQKKTWNHILACCDGYVGEEVCYDVVFWSAK